MDARKAMTRHGSKVIRKRCFPALRAAEAAGPLPVAQTSELFLLRGAGFLCPWRGRAGLFFPTRGKEPKGDRWQPIRASTMAAPRPLAAWFGDETSRCARLIPSSRGRLGAGVGAMFVARWRPGGTGGPPSLRGGVWACQGGDTTCGLTSQEWRGSPQRCMAGGARVTSVGLRRRSPPLAPMTEGASLTRSGATVGEPRPSARNQAPFPSGEGVTAVP